MTSTPVYGFFELPESKQTWFIDTCVWSDIASSEELKRKFIRYVRDNSLLAGLSNHTLFELSRAKNLLSRIDELLLQLPLYVWLALPYDNLLDAEQSNYPIKPRIKWLPLSAISQEGQKVENLVEKFSQDPFFVKVRQKTLDFGNDRFMSLEQFKKNFPPINGKYTTEQAYVFAQENSLDYFRRREPRFLRRVGDRNFKPEGIPSLFARSLFLFYKYYIHGQSPGKSDFIDYVHINYLPYVDVYVTERNASNVIHHMQSEGNYFLDKKILNVSEFIEMMLSA